MTKIFISYRRDDSADVAGRIYDRLVAKFGKDAVFKDVDSIPFGVNFKKHLEGVVQQCAVELVIIGKQWLDRVIASLEQWLAVGTTAAPETTKPKFMLPLLEWINIPAGSVTLEKDLGTYDVAPFAIAKYPVTNQQYQAFIDDGGYREDRWWQDLAGGKQTPTKPGWNTPNHPRENVNWYEAVAFSRWLAAKTELPITLPTEMQWQWAAIKDTGWAYPYGKTFEKTKSNTRESGIEQTTPVDSYPQGVSPFGVMDMSGNVWEWTLSEYSNPISNNLINNNVRVVRGGSWGDDRDLARAACRVYDVPGDRYYGIGFRVVCSVPLP
ncbi:MAG: SUMF1/EgtB/PvdO family nonheme iron enzyme [Chloroflexota bacterium]